MSDERTPTAEHSSCADDGAPCRGRPICVCWCHSTPVRTPTAEPVTEADALYIRGFREGVRQAVADRDEEVKRLRAAIKALLFLPPFDFPNDPRDSAQRGDDARAALAEPDR